MTIDIESDFIRPSSDSIPYAITVPRQNFAYEYRTRPEDILLLATNVKDFTPDLPVDVETTSAMFRGANGGAYDSDVSFFEIASDQYRQQLSYVIRFNMFDMISSQAVGFDCG